MNSRLVHPLFQRKIADVFNHGATAADVEVGGGFGEIKLIQIGGDTAVDAG